ncbi:MAG: phosphoribosylanthranilate isomerase [Candidatus Binataceae bacterium]
MVRIKICGVTRVADAELAIALGADMIGLNFYPPSPRSISRERAGEIARAVAGRALIAGVFVNATREYIEQRRREAALDLLQFHGDEDESALAGWPVKVIRAFRVKAGAPAGLIGKCGADFFLFDTYHPGLFGGTGRVRPLGGLGAFSLARVFISGGLSPGNVAAAAALNPYAVDVASGVESSPGIKDAAKLRSFIVNAKSPR